MNRGHLPLPGQHPSLPGIRAISLQTKKSRRTGNGIAIKHHRLGYLQPKVNCAVHHGTACNHEDFRPPGRIFEYRPTILNNNPFTDTADILRVEIDYPQRKMSREGKGKSRLQTNQAQARPAEALTQVSRRPPRANRKTLIAAVPGVFRQPQKPAK